MHDYERVEKSRVLPCIYFIFLMIVGNLFLMNLFLAILLKNFEEQKLSNKDELREESDHEGQPFSFKKSISFA